MKTFGSVLVLLMIVTTGVAAELSGRASVVDGDTIEVGDTTVRLYGIDAPEAGQKCNQVGSGTWPCGTRATEAIAALVEDREVTCRSLGKDDFDRVLGICETGDVIVNRKMVADGHAWAFVKYADDYIDVEARAREGGLGV